MDRAKLQQHKIINENVKMYSGFGFSTNSIVRMIYQLEIFSCSNKMKVLWDILSSLFVYESMLERASTTTLQVGQRSDRMQNN
jgi:hypothetical protein